MIGVLGNGDRDSLHEGIPGVGYQHFGEHEARNWAVDYGHSGIVVMVEACEERIVGTPITNAHDLTQCGFGVTSGHLVYLVNRIPKLLVSRVTARCIRDVQNRTLFWEKRCQHFSRRLDGTAGFVSGLHVRDGS